jgi:hypothetical protein
MAGKTPMAQIMVELTASSGYRKAVKEMRQLQSKFSCQRHIMLFNPTSQTIEMLENEGFTVTRTKIKEYIQFKCSW